MKSKSINQLEKEFLNEFKIFRRENNLTQSMLANYSKVSREKIARIENGMHSPSIRNIIKILGAVGYTIKIEKIGHN